MMTYEQAQEYIASLAPRGWRLGLDRMQEFVSRAALEGALGDGEKPKFIHIAGTNGKGSVTAFAQSLLVESGVRIGAFFSPYVYEPRERIQFGREFIPKEEIARLTDELKDIGESLSDTHFGGVTEFEFKVALGFKYWQKMNCDWVALEVGLGGKLDATSVITPAVSVISSIGLDHMAILGETIEEIASEKAGIIKPKVPVVLGEMPSEARLILERLAGEKGSPCWRFGTEILLSQEGDGTWTVKTPRSTISGLNPGLKGAMQPHNMALALGAYELAGFKPDPAVVRLGIERAVLPGRFETLKVGERDFVFDGAHNRDAAKALAASLREQYPGRSITLVTGMVSGHDPAEFYRELLPLTSKVHIVPIDFHRAYPVQDLNTVLEKLGVKTHPHDSVQEGVEEAIKTSNDVIVVTGSFYLLGEVKQALWLSGLALDK